jgi:hypothetical protein
VTSTIRSIIESAIAVRAVELASIDANNGFEHYVDYTPYLRDGSIVIPDPSDRATECEPHYCWGDVTCHRDGSISIRWCSHDDGPWPAVRIQNPTVEAVLHEIRDVQLPDGV